MNNGIVYQHNFAGRGYKSFAVLDLEQFFKYKGWKEGMPPQTKKTIREAITFLSLALSGEKLFEDANRKKTFSINLPAIRAYNLAVSAYENLDLKQYTFDQVLTISITMMKTILNNELLTDVVFTPEIEKMLYKYIKELGKTLYTDY
jgi:hypothetical protein